MRELQFQDIFAIYWNGPYSHKVDHGPTYFYNECFALLLQDSLLVDGVSFKKTFSYAGFEMQPKTYKNPKIALLNIELELKAERDNAEIRLDSVEVCRYSYTFYVDCRVKSFLLMEKFFLTWVNIV